MFKALASMHSADFSWRLCVFVIYFALVSFCACKSTDFEAELSNIDYSCNGNEFVFWLDRHPSHNGTEREDGCTSSAIVGMKVAQYHLADLNGDGKLDAAVELKVYHGGVGYFSNVLAVVLNGQRGDGPLPSSTFGVAIYSLTRFTIESGVITLGYLDRRPGEAKVIAPSVPTVKQFRLTEGGLGLENIATQTGSPMHMV